MKIPDDPDRTARTIVDTIPQLLHVIEEQKASATTETGEALPAELLARLDDAAEHLRIRFDALDLCLAVGHAVPRFVAAEASAVVQHATEVLGDVFTARGIEPDQHEGELARQIANIDVADRGRQTFPDIEPGDIIEP